MFNQIRRALEADKKLAGLTEQLERLSQTVSALGQRCAALEAQREADSASLADLRDMLRSLSKRVDWEAEQVHHTATALMEQFRHSAKAEQR